MSAKTKHLPLQLLIIAEESGVKKSNPYEEVAVDAYLNHIAVVKVQLFDGKDDKEQPDFAVYSEGHSDRQIKSTAWAEVGFKNTIIDGFQLSQQVTHNSNFIQNGTISAIKLRSHSW